MGSPTPATGAHATATAPAAGRKLPLLLDPAFALGCRVLAPTPGAEHAQGDLRPNPSPASGQPVWRLGQWNSRASLAGAEAVKLERGAVRFSDASKSITFAPPATPEAGLRLALNTIPEYDSQAPDPAARPIHLMLEQTIDQAPALRDLARLDFHLEYRLDRLAGRKETAPAKGYGVQGLVYLGIEGRNPQASAEETDFLWFEIPLVNERERIPRPSEGKDPATGKFIYNPGGEVFSKISAHDRQWVMLDRNLVALIWQGIKRAWNGHMITHTKDLNNFRIREFRLGWQVQGVFGVAMQLRNLSLTAILK